MNISNEEFAAIHKKAGKMALSLNDFVQSSEIGKGNPRELVIGMYLFATSALISSHPDLTDDERRKLAAGGMVTRLALDAMEAVLSKLDAKMNEMRGSGSQQILDQLNASSFTVDDPERN